jgi:hypothetical protein
MTTHETTRSPATTPATTPADTPAADVRTGAAALLAAVVSAGIGVTQLLYPQDTDPQIDPRTRVILVGFTVVLWALAAVYLGLAGRARSAWAPRTAAAGTVLLSVGSLSSAINGEDLAVFPVVAAVANALWLVGSVALAVSLWKAGRVHRPIAALVWVPMPLSIFGSQLGGGVPAGAYLAVLGWLLVRGHLDRR